MSKFSNIYSLYSHIINRLIELRSKGNAVALTFLY